MFNSYVSLPEGKIHSRESTSTHLLKKRHGRPSSLVRTRDDSNSKSVALLGHQQVARVIGKVQEKALDQFGHPTKIGLFHGFPIMWLKQQ